MDLNMTDSNGDLPVTESQRQELLLELHTRLFWVGEQIPESVEVEGTKYKLHEGVWELLGRDMLSDDEKRMAARGVTLLRSMAKEKEHELETGQMSLKEANALRNEIAGILRAAMVLEDVLDGTAKRKEKEFHDIFSAQRTEDVRKWLNFLKDVGKI